MRTVKAKLALYDDEMIVVPIIIPDVDEVKAFAAKLHAEGQGWQGELFGWQAEYTPERSDAPLDSNMTFTPADFCIGESDVWFYSLMWEQGKDNDPVEYLDESYILEPFDVDETMLSLAPQQVG
ncbi:MAG: hypothetical protein SVT56_11580 [Chloroflexota bacterium]|nr:hypothetical protein [Chloroflexota bacterium]